MDSNVAAGQFNERTGVTTEHLANPQREALIQRTAASLRAVADAPSTRRYQERLELSLATPPALPIWLALDPAWRQAILLARCRAAQTVLGLATVTPGDWADRAWQALECVVQGVVPI